MPRRPDEDQKSSRPENDAQSNPDSQSAPASPIPAMASTIAPIIRTNLPRPSQPGLPSFSPSFSFSLPPILPYTSRESQDQSPVIDIPRPGGPLAFQPRLRPLAAQSPASPWTFRTPISENLSPSRSPVSQSSHSPSLALSSTSQGNIEPTAGRIRSYDQAFPAANRELLDTGREAPSPLGASLVRPRHALPALYSTISAGSGSNISTLSSPRNLNTSGIEESSYSSARAVPPDADPPDSRFRLHIRQQPRAARAGPDGKDRRVVDPPPILQLQIADFNPSSESDVAELKSSFYVVHARLVSASSPRQDLSILSSTREDGSREVQRLLLGQAVSSPFFCADDPDPETAPPPFSVRPPSPSAHLIMKPQSQRSRADQPPRSSPATFFIFADISVRKAGEYRLEFRLMKISPSMTIPGSRVPFLHSVTSRVFKVVNAKDFDQVQPSTPLVRGLLVRGASFPLKLKKGKRDGQSRRSEARRGGAEEEHDDDDNDDDDDDDDYDDDDDDDDDE